MDTSVKKNVKYTKQLLRERSINEIWDNRKRPNMRITKIEENDETQVKGTENIFTKIKEEQFLIPKKEVSFKAQES